MKTNGALAIAALGTAVIATAGFGQGSGTSAAGVNPKDNITKSEIIYRYDFLDQGDYTQSLTFKYDRAFTAQFGANVELPIVAYKGFGLEDAGLGDINFRLRYSTEFGGGTAIVGAEVVLPTASEDTLGRGKVQFNPAIGYVVPMSQTSFLYLGYKHYLSIAGDDARPDINESQPRVIVGYTNPNGWWLLGDANYTKSWESEAEQLDIEAEYGRMIGPSTGLWARVGTSALDCDRDAMILFGVRFIR